MLQGEHWHTDFQKACLIDVQIFSKIADLLVWMFNLPFADKFQEYINKKYMQLSAQQETQFFTIILK